MRDAGPGVLFRAEIREQPARWRELIRTQRKPLEAAASLLQECSPQLLVLVARGSSDHAAMYGQYLAHNLLRVPAMLFTPSTVTGFGTRLRYPRTVMLALSQSGESPDLLESVQVTMDSGVPVIAFTNGDANTLASQATRHVDISAGPELSVAASKTYTTELLALHAVLALATGTDWHDLEMRAENVAAAAEDLLSSSTTLSSELAGRLADADRILVVGRGYSMATAREAALKLMETCAMPASGWSAADASHGPLGQVGPGTVVVALQADATGHPSISQFAEAAASMGATVVTSGGDSLALGLRSSTQPSDAIAVALLPLLEIIPLQMLALELSVLRGLDPDHPAGLRKVTRTR